MVQARSFAKMLDQTVRRYANRAIEAAQVIEELIQLAREMREANARGEALGLSEDELAFYDALETNDSAVQVLGDETLREIARELVETVRSNVKIDWTLRRTCAPTCGGSSSVSCENTATRPTSRRRPRGRYWSRRRPCPMSGPHSRIPSRRYASSLATVATSGAGRHQLRLGDQWATLICKLDQLESDLDATAHARPTARMCQLLVAAEDRRFTKHLGVDPLALCRACWNTYFRASAKVDQRLRCSSCGR